MMFISGHNVIFVVVDLICAFGLVAVILGSRREGTLGCTLCYSNTARR